MTKHTPEPWAVDPNDQREISPAGDMQIGIASVSNIDPCDTTGKWEFGTQSQGNAARIVACVNACAGLDTVSLRAVAQMGGLAQRLPVISGLMAQRTELLADLIDAAAQLRAYEILHRAKGTADSLAKAEVNANLAARFEQTIAKATA
ncbi:hypothetical protein [Pseudomonas sp. DrBHI1]|uniref:hypothetical protein n=1 Tax=Pseudomonas sp. DrBHI1 TaxID=2006091 RepID=UPI00117A6CB9|nr:hypothetical protein [Pseudomonas sp. DrBHI1]